MPVISIRYESLSPVESVKSGEESTTQHRRKKEQTRKDITRGRYFLSKNTIRKMFYLLFVAEVSGPLRLSAVVTSVVSFSCMASSSSSSFFGGGNRLTSIAPLTLPSLLTFLTSTKRRQKKMPGYKDWHTHIYISLEASYLLSWDRVFPFRCLKCKK